MNHMLIPPFDPKPSEPVRPSMIYVQKSLKWEYKQVVRDLEKEQPLDETELNPLGEQGWEMTGVAQHLSKTYYYFKRQLEN